MCISKRDQTNDSLDMSLFSGEGALRAVGCSREPRIGTSCGPGARRWVPVTLEATSQVHQVVGPGISGCWCPRRGHKWLHEDLLSSVPAESCGTNVGRGGYGQSCDPETETCYLSDPGEVLGCLDS